MIGPGLLCKPCQEGTGGLRDGTGAENDMTGSPNCRAAPPGTVQISQRTYAARSILPLLLPVGAGLAAFSKAGHALSADQRPRVLMKAAGTR